MKILTLSAAVMLLLVTACKTNKGTTSTAATKTETTAAANTEMALAADLSAAADKRYPFVPKADIAAGQKLYTGECGRCHALPDVMDRTEDKWPGTIDWMAPKAKLDEKQKQQVLQYVLCALDVKKAGK